MAAITVRTRLRAPLMTPSYSILFNLGSGEMHQVAPALLLIRNESAELGRRARLRQRAEAVERGLGLFGFQSRVDGAVDLGEDRLGRAERRYHAGPGIESEVREAALDQRWHVRQFRPAS